MRLAALAGILCLALTALAACMAGPSPTPWPRESLERVEPPWFPAADALPASRAEAALGALHYQRYCVSCHGPAGDGRGSVGRALRPPPPDFTDRDYMFEQRPDWYLRSLEEGIAGSAMQPWDHVLDVEARWDTVFYVWSIATPPAAYELGARLYADRCASCHGADGAGRSTRRFDDPSRVVSSRAEDLSALEVEHPDLLADLDSRARRSLIEHTWTFLYRPALVEE